MAFLFDLSKPHFAFYSVPAAYFLTIAPGIYRSIAAGKNFDRSQPRQALELCAKDPTMDKKLLKRIQRAEAAQANGFESFGMYAAGVAAAVATGVPVETLNALSAGYLVSRALYNFVYVVLQDNRRLATLRSLVWGVGMAMVGAIWVKAGNRATALGGMSI